MNQNKDSEDSFSRYIHLLSGTKDLTLIALKGHLLLEEMLVRIIEAAVEAPEELPKRLSFDSRLKLVRAICPPRNAPKTGSPYEVIEALNVLRNKMVHHIDPAVEDLIRNVGRPYLASKFVLPEEVSTDIDALRIAISISRGFLEGLLSDVKKRRSTESGEKKS